MCLDWKVQIQSRGTPADWAVWLKRLQEIPEGIHLEFENQQGRLEEQRVSAGTLRAAFCQPGITFPATTWQAIVRPDDRMRIGFILMGSVSVLYYCNRCWSDWDANVCVCVFFLFKCNWSGAFYYKRSFSIKPHERWVTFEAFGRRASNWIQCTTPIDIYHMALQSERSPPYNCGQVLHNWFHMLRRLWRRGLWTSAALCHMASDLSGVSDF